MKMRKEIEGITAYEIKAWFSVLRSQPKKVLISEDFSQSYEMTAARVLELENGRFALVTESGCSCYNYEDAEVEIFPTRETALEAFNKWVKENDGSR